MPLALPSDETLEAEGAVIGEVRIHVGQIFDPEQPGENRKLFRAANSVHLRTRPGVIEEQLLFRPGDHFSRRVLEESERLLRQNPYLYDAEIRAVSYEKNTVDIEVSTRDVWTLEGGFGVGRSGGENTAHFQIQDRNLLGTGKTLSLERRSNVDRSSTELYFQDSNLWGSRSRLGVSLSSNSDGHHRALDFERPFFSLDSHWAAGLRAVSDDRVDSWYSLGTIAQQFRHQSEQFELSGGLSRGLDQGYARRFTAGFTFERDRFAPAAGYPDSTLLPPDRTLAFPWIGLEHVEDEFRETRDFDQIARTEDLYLGRAWRARVGWSSSWFGATVDAATLDGSLLQGFEPGREQTLLVATQGSGRIESGGISNALVGGSVRYYWRSSDRGLFFATLSGDLGHRLDTEKQLLLGGDSGLRGYPLRYQEGDGRLLLTLEQRLFTGFQLFHLYYVGGAVFFDVGRTFGQGPAGTPNLGLLRDVGVGLRLGSSRSGLGHILHLDLAFPLDGDGSIRSLQWLVTTKRTF